MEGLGPIIGGVFSALGSLSQGYSQADIDSYQAQVAANNAKIAKQNAEWATEIGETQATRQGLKTRAVVGAEAAGQAASGIDVNQGSTVDIRSSSEALGELDALTIRSNAARQAYGFDVQSTNFKAEQQLYDYEGSQARKAGVFGAVGSLLGGAFGGGSQYQQWQNVGGGGGGGLGGFGGGGSASGFGGYAPISGGSSNGNYGGIM